MADVSNPLHTTVHHNGWVGRNNPHKFTTDNTLHGRFEGKFVDGRIKIDDVRPRVIVATAKVIAQPRDAILQFINDSYALVDDVYRLEQREKFSETTKSPEAQDDSSSMAHRRMARRSCAISGGRRTAPRISNHLQRLLLAEISVWYTRNPCRRSPQKPPAGRVIPSSGWCR